MAKKVPHHMHALTKASATHLHKHGHISAQQHKQIVSKAEKGMAGARGGGGPPMATPRQSMNPPAPSPGPSLASAFGGGQLGGGDEDMD